MSAVHSCSSCYNKVNSEREDSSFLCVTCNPKGTTGVGSGSPVSLVFLRSRKNGHVFFCDGCIMSHIRRGHDVRDGNEFKITVCSMHSNIVKRFCDTCNSLICNNCAFEAKHSKHLLKSLDEKANEVKLKAKDLSQKISKTKRKLSEFRTEFEKLLNIIKNNALEQLPSTMRMAAVTFCDVLISKTQTNNFLRAIRKK